MKRSFCVIFKGKLYKAYLENPKRHLRHLDLYFMSNENFPSPTLLHFLGFDEITFPCKNNQPAEATSGSWKLDKLALISHDVHFDLMNCFFLSIL